MPVLQIAQWIHDKPLWWKHAVRLTLENGELDGDDLTQIYKVARIEHLLDPPSVEYINARVALDFTGYVAEQFEVTLAELSNVSGVAALAEKQTLSFNNNGLHIVYGDNGAGKSSYAGILKNACLTRGVCPAINGNVFENNNPTPQASIRVESNGDIENHDWNLQYSNTESLKAIRVFDSSSAHHYVNKEDTLGFKPAGLNLLTELTKAVKSVKAIIDEDTMPGNGLISLVHRNSGSSVAHFVNNISARSDETTIGQYLATEDELQRIEPLRQDIANNKLQTPESIKAKLKQQKQLLEPLKRLCCNVLRYLSDAAYARLKELHADKNSKQKLAEEIKLATLQGLPLKAVGGIEWQTLWNAAKCFLEETSTTGHFPLQEDDECPLCLQTIGEISAERMVMLNGFINDDAAKNASEASSTLTNAITLISTQDLSLKNLKAALTELEKFQQGFASRVESLFSVFHERQKVFTSSILPKELPTLDSRIIDELIKLIDDLSSQIESTNSNEDLANLIQKKEAQLLELEDKKFVLENKDSILSNIHRYKIIAKLESILSECNTRTISTLSAQINKEGIVAPLVDAFNQELQQFGFNRFTVNVQSRNSAGQQQFKLAIAEADEPVVAKVASEGEQRCIAIAAFLAEMKADSRKSAVIFDDPVNSLSHQWSSRVAARLVSEAKERQVIVFTHDIVFFKLMLEEAERQVVTHSSITLERSRKYSGIVRENAPWEALTTSKRLRTLNVELQLLKKIDREGTESEFRQASRYFYGRLREAWERLVEEKLLNKVVNRFERGIHTQRLSRLVDLSQEDFDKVDSGMSKCSTYFTGHDSAPAIGDPYPTIPEIEQDLGEIKEFLDELQGKRKRS